MKALFCGSVLVNACLLKVFLYRIFKLTAYSYGHTVFVLNERYDGVMFRTSFLQTVLSIKTQSFGPLDLL